MAFDTLSYAKKLQEAGFTPRQAEAQAEALREVVAENLATKRDLKDVEAALRRDLKEVEARLMAEIETLRRDMKEMDGGLRRDMKEMETRLSYKMDTQRRDIIIWLGGITIAAVSALGVLLKLLH